MSARFAPNNFQYNTRVSLTLLPSLVILAGFGGSVSVCIGMVGSLFFLCFFALFGCCLKAPADVRDMPHQAEWKCPVHVYFQVPAEILPCSCMFD